jgi:hypothetical protein
MHGSPCFNKTLGAFPGSFFIGSEKSLVNDWKELRYMPKKARKRFTGPASNSPPVVTAKDPDGDEDIRFDAKHLCSGCGANFLSVKAFNAHRIGDYGGPIYDGSKMVGFTKSERRCRTPEEMRERGLESKSGFLPKYDDGKVVADVLVTSWFFPADENAKERLKMLSEKHRKERVKAKQEG